jgi:hypothetical protein
LSSIPDTLFLTCSTLFAKLSLLSGVAGILALGQER